MVDHWYHQRTIVCLRKHMMTVSLLQQICACNYCLYFLFVGTHTHTHAHTDNALPVDCRFPTIGDEGSSKLQWIDNPVVPCCTVL
jgi:hypothetical protein